MLSVKHIVIILNKITFDRMTKGFKKVSTEVPMADIKRALALMRYRTASPTEDSLAYASISACAQVLSISYEKTR